MPVRFPMVVNARASLLAGISAFCRGGMVVVCLSVMVPAHAGDLLQQVRSALGNDPQLKSAAAQRDATQEQRTQAYAQVLPQISFQAMRSNNSTDTYVANNGVSSAAQSFDYPSDSKSLVLRQALLRPRLMFNVYQGDFKAQQGELQLEVATQKGIANTVNAYTSVLLNTEKKYAAERELKATEVRLLQAEKLRRAGEISDVDLSATKSKARLAAAKLRESTAALAAALRELSSTTGLALTDSAPREWSGIARNLLALLKDLPLGKPEIELTQNPEIAAQQLVFEIARLEVKKAKSDHAPTLDLVAGLSEGNSAQDIAINRYTRTRSIGLQLNIPIYAGGMTQSVVREQGALSEKAQHDLDALRMRIENDRGRTLDDIHVKLEMLNAGLAEMTAAELSLRQAEMGIEGGVKSMVDLLDARANLQTAQANLAEYATGLVVAYVQHLKALGTLDVGVIEPLSQALSPN